MKNFFKWIAKHVRPTVKYKGPTDFDKMSTNEIKENVKDKTEVGVKFKFKF